MPWYQKSFHQSIWNKKPHFSGSILFHLRIINVFWKAIPKIFIHRKVRKIDYKNLWHLRKLWKDTKLIKILKKFFLIFAWIVDSFSTLYFLWLFWLFSEFISFYDGLWWWYKLEICILYLCFVNFNNYKKFVIIVLKKLLYKN